MVNYFRSTLLLSLLIGLYSYYGGPSSGIINIFRRAPTPFVYVAANWPSIGDPPAADTSGYCIAAEGWSKFNYPLPAGVSVPVQDSTWSVPVVPQKVFGGGGCASAPAGAWNDDGSCWWTCGASPSSTRTGLTGQNCLRPKDISECTSPGKRWALSFDDGPMPSTTDLLKYLQDRNLKATFFLVGSHMVKYPEIVVALYNAGMELGIHTWSHHALTT
jgi:hypothetical protein